MRAQRPQGAFGFALLLATALLNVTSGSAALAQNCSGEALIDVTLPQGGRWQMCWEQRTREGIVLRDVSYTPPQGSAIRLFHQAGVAQIHVPYDDNGARFHDVSDYGLGSSNLNDLSAADCPGGDRRLDGSKRAVCVTMVAGEATLDTRAQQRTSHALEIFSVSHVGAYNYIPRWRFGDDGSVEVAMGATGSLQRTSTNSSRLPHGWPLNASGTIGISHMHNYFWRLDFDLGSSSSDDVVEEINFAPGSNGTRILTTSTFTTEAARSVNASSQRFWRVLEGASSNGNGHPRSWEIRPTDVGHRDEAPEAFTHNDLYITRYQQCEVYASHNPTGSGCADEVSDFVNGEVIDDLVVWLGLSFHHIPRAEDRPRMSTHWNRFRLLPRDVHEANPFAQEIPNSAPVLGATEEQRNSEDEVVDLLLSATDADADVLTFSATGLPAGLAIDSASGRIEGTLASGSVGTYSVEVTVSDGELSDQRSFDWIIDPAGLTPPDTSSPGTGLLGTYYADRELASVALERIDPSVAFDWGSDSPHPAVPADSFSVRWQGWILPPATGSYTFTTITNNGSRLWVDHQQLVDHWTSGAPWPAVESGTVSLVAGRPVLVTQEFFEASGGAEASLLWQPPGQAQEVVPTAHLYPFDADGNRPPTAVLDASSRNGFAPHTVDFDGSQSFDPDGGALTYRWSFGDGSTSNSASPSYLYDQPGTYEVSLVVADSQGWVASAGTTVEVLAPTVTAGGLLGEYFDGRNFEISKLVRADAGVDFDWGSDSPAPSVSADSFSVRWQGFVRPEFDETYEITTTTNNGARLWIDGVLVIDHWTSDAPWPAIQVAQVVLQAGEFHAIRFEMFEARGSASARLEWSSPSRSREVIPAARLYSEGLANLPPSAVVSVSPAIAPAGSDVTFDASPSTDPEGQPLTYSWEFGDGATSNAVSTNHSYTQAGTYTAILTVTDSVGQSDTVETTVVATPGSPGSGLGTGLLGTYFDQSDLSGGSLSRLDPIVDFSWGTGSPDPSLPADNFSVRWLGWIKPEYSEIYTLTTTANNGVRLWLDGQLLIDRYSSAGPWPATDNAVAALEAGAFHFLQIEYFEGTGGAEMSLEWSSPSQSGQVIPTDRLYPAESGNRSPVAAVTASQLAVRVQTEIQLDARDSWDPDGDALAYRWILGERVVSTEPSPRLLFDLPGTQALRLTVVDSRGLSDLARLEVVVTPSGEPPQPEIQLQGGSLPYRPGDLVTVLGQAFDPEDGWLGPESLEWRVEVVVSDEVEATAVSLSGEGGTFVLPHMTLGARARICLTAFDSEGQEAETCEWLGGQVFFFSDFEQGHHSDWSSDN